MRRSSGATPIVEGPASDRPAATVETAATVSAAAAIPARRRAGRPRCDRLASQIARATASSPISKKATRGADTRPDMTKRSHTSVAASRNPITTRKVAIHGPGRGSTRPAAGNAARSRYGEAIPVPIAPNIAAVVPESCVSAKPSAVPRKGAEQGVAISVAKKPVTRWPASPSDGPDEPTFASDPGRWISNSPHMLSVKRRITTASAPTKSGSWNWIPQPTATPAARAPIAAPASSRKERMIPAAVARLPVVRARLPPSALFISPKTLSDSTGSTHGIAFRISPPRKPRSTNHRNPRPAPPSCDPWPPVVVSAAKNSEFATSPPAAIVSPTVAGVVTGARHILSSHAW